MDEDKKDPSRSPAGESEMTASAIGLSANKPSPAKAHSVLRSGAGCSKANKVTTSKSPKLEQSNKPTTSSSLPDPAGDFIDSENGKILIVTKAPRTPVATETEIIAPSQLHVPDDDALIHKENQTDDPESTLKRDKNLLESWLVGAGVKMPPNLPSVTTVFMAEGPPPEFPARRRRTTTLSDDSPPAFPVRRRTTLGGDTARGRAQAAAPRVLIVGEEEEGFTDHLDFHLRALEKRMSRDDMEAMKILKRFRRSIVDTGDDREVYYKRKHLLAWQAAIAMPRTKKTPFPTDIPLAATSFLRHKLPKKERIRRRFLQMFRCFYSSPRYVEDVLTQVSVNNFNARYENMKKEEDLGGFGLRRRHSMFSSTHPQFIERDEMY